MRRASFLTVFYWGFRAEETNKAKEVFATMLVVNIAERLLQITRKSTYTKPIGRLRLSLICWKKEIDTRNTFESIAPIAVTTGMVFPTTRKEIEKKLGKKIGVARARIIMRDHFSKCFLPVLDVNSHREKYVYLPHLFDRLFEIKKSPDSFKTVPYSRFFLIESEAEAQKVLKSTFRKHNIKWKYFMGLYNRKRRVCK